MKCVRCGHGVGLTRRGLRLLDGNYICFKCFDEIGFDKSDRIVFNNPYTWEAIKNGKAAYLKPKKKPQKAYTFKVVGVTYDHGDGDPQRILKLYMNEYGDHEFQYEGMTNAEIRDEMNYDDKVYQFEPVDFSPIMEPTKYEGAAAIRVLLEDDNKVYVIGWIAAEQVETVNELLAKHVVDITGAVTGGKYKFVSYPDDKVETETDNYGATVTISISDNN